MISSPLKHSISAMRRGSLSPINTPAGMLLLAWFLVVLSLSPLASANGPKRQFHAYSFENRTYRPECKKYIKDHEKTDIQQLISKYRLWGNVISKKQTVTPNSVLFGIGDALDEIWKHQHPKDCSKAMFLIAGTDHVGGFGSELHVTGSILGLAMDMGRVYLQNPVVSEVMRWEIENHHCQSQNKTNLECYYEPWSSCTVFDALGPNAVDILLQSHLKKNPLPAIDWKDAPPSALHDPKYKHSFVKQYEHERVIQMSHMATIKYGAIPSSFVPLLRCSPMNPKHFYYWWRAVSMTYLMRPNPYAIEWIKIHQLTHFDHMIDSAVGVYIRRGDKAREMRLIPVREYQLTINLMWSKNYIQPYQSSHHHSSSGEATTMTTKLIFLGSEDSQVIEEMIRWSKSNTSSSSQGKREYKIAITEIFERKGLFAEKSEKERNVKTLPLHHPDEYLSMMLNLHYFLRSAAWICTLASNYCRVIDELRTTVAAKADHPFADLSFETCSRPPCIYQEIGTFVWR
jgi:hypothetical protein